MDWEQSGAPNDGGARSKAPKKKKRGRKIVIALVVVAIVLFMAVRGCAGSGDEGKSEQTEWSASGLAAMLPDPPSDSWDVSIDSEEELSVDFENCSKSDYEQYVEACIEKGFDVESEKGDGDYEAFTDEGYKLSLYFYDSMEEISVDLEAPMEMSDITWPKVGAAALVPVPSSTTGNITSDSSTFFNAYLGETSKEEFVTYAQSCMDMGFTVDYDKGDTWFYADDANGNHVSVNYRGFNVMQVKVDVAEDQPAEAPAEDAGNDAAAPAPASDSGTAVGVSADFKKTMDDYEAFFDEYVEFMNKYSANSSSPELIAQYADMMARYSDMMSSMDAIDENSLSAADSAYYVEVQGRILQKLAQVQ